MARKHQADCKITERQALCALMAWLVYEAESTWDDNDDIGPVRPFHAGGFTGFASVRDDAVYIAIRGTHQPTDWLANLSCDLVPHVPEGRAHAGFLRGAQAIVEAILDSPHLPDDRPFVFTGHSLGGALSILSAHLLSQRDRVIADVIVFGCPRVFDLDAQQSYNFSLGDVTTRFVLGADPVPWIPPFFSPRLWLAIASPLWLVGAGQWWIWIWILSRVRPIPHGYRHVGKEVRIGKKRLIPRPNLLFALIDILRGIRAWKGVGEAHYMRCYRLALLRVGIAQYVEPTSEVAKS